MEGKDEKGRFIKGKTYEEIYGIEKAHKIRKKLSEAMKKYIKSHPEIQFYQKGIHHSLKTEFKKGDLKLIGNRTNVGRKQSKETKEKKSLANKGQIPWIKGKYHTEETKKKMSLVRLGRKHSEEWKEKIRSARLKQILPNRDTSIEVKIQNELKSRNILFVTHKVLLNMCQADIFIEPNIAIFCDGCYWHGCEQCFDKNELDGLQRARIIRDNLVTQKLINSNYIVLRFWEHEIRNNLEVVMNKIIDKIQMQKEMVTG